MWSEERTYVQCDWKYGYLGALECFIRRHFQLCIIDSNLIGVLPDYLTKSRGRLLGLFVRLWRQHGHAGLRCTVPGASFILSLHEQHLWKPCGAGHRCDTPWVASWEGEGPVSLQGRLGSRLGGMSNFPPDGARQELGSFCGQSPARSCIMCAFNFY